MPALRKILLVLAFGAIALLALSPAASAKGGKPDLVVTKVSKPPKQKLAGTKLGLVVTVANKGARAGKSKLGVYLAKGRKHAKRGKLLKRVKVKPLRPGQAKKLKLKLRLPAKTAAGRYRLIACADDKKQVRESNERDNCRASRTISVSAKTAPPPPPPASNAAPAFTTTDQIDWGKTEDATDTYPDAGFPIVATLRAANGLPGQAGYTRSDVSPVAFATGNTTALSFTNNDDGQTTVALPFAFPFGGIEERTVSVGTNGWLGFGTSPALDYYPNGQHAYYIGVGTAVGEFYRGLMPYWEDLSLDDQGHGPGAAREVTAPDGSFVAFQWEVSRLGSPGSPTRTFQVVLFPDGRFRFDYPSANEAGGYEAFVGYSLGTGPASEETVASEAADVPGSSLLFTPKPVAANAALPAGTGSLTVPRGATFLEGSGCSLTQAPTAFSDGSASCPFSSLAPGRQEAHTVTFAMPLAAAGETRPENVKYTGAYQAGPVTLTDLDEVPDLSTYLEATSIALELEYVSPPSPEVGVQSTFVVEVGTSPSTGLDQPELTLALPVNATLDAVEIEGDPLPCGPVSGGQITCHLPSGVQLTGVTVKVTPTSGGTLTLGATVAALNAATVSKAIGVTP